MVSAEPADHRQDPSFSDEEQSGEGLTTETPGSPGKDKKPRKEWELGGFWATLRGYTPAEWEYLMLRLYRLAPITDRLAGGGSTKFISKYNEPVDEQQIKLEHGSGRYRLMLNKYNPANQKDFPIARVEFDVEDMKYPPNVPPGEWVDDPRNKRWAWAKPKDPNAPQPAPVTGEGMNVPQLFGMVRDMIKELRPELPVDRQQDTTRAVVEAMKTSHAEAFEMFKQQNAAADPGKLLDMVKGILALQNTSQKQGPDPMMTFMLDELKALRQQNTELMTRMLDKQTGNGGSFKDQISTFRDIKELFGESSGGGGGSWKDMIIPVVQQAMGPLTTIAAAFLNRPQAVNPAQRTFATSIAPEPPQPPQQYTGAVMPPPQTPAMDPQVQEELQQTLFRIAPAMMMRLQSGATGLDLADWLIDGEGIRPWQLIKNVGRENLVATIKQFPQAWAMIQPMEARFLIFLDEFLDWTPIEEEQQAAAEPEPALASPPSPTDKAAKPGKKVKA